MTAKSNGRYTKSKDKKWQQGWTAVVWEQRLDNDIVGLAYAHEPAKSSGTTSYGLLRTQDTAGLQN